MSLTQHIKRSKQWIKRQRKRLRFSYTQHPFWSYLHSLDLNQELHCFLSGQHRFGPLKQLSPTDPGSQTFHPQDQLFTHLLFHHIKPTFKHILSPTCHHLQGPTSIKKIAKRIGKQLSTGAYTHFFRLDIKSFYATINHPILLNQVQTAFDDPWVHSTMKSIITTLIDIDGKLHQPTRGIPVRATLSPFFGALYLTPLDRAFENLPGVFYVRFMDDVLILTKTHKQLKKARKRVFKILRTLKLTLSPSKSAYGALAKKPFHYLGFQFAEARTSSNPRKPVRVSLHPRTHQRARDRVQDQAHLGVDPHHRLKYLERWCSWWQLKELLTTSDIACAWREYIYAQDPIPIDLFINESTKWPVHQNGTLEKVILPIG